MKKSKIWIVGLIILLLASGLVMTSCGGCPNNRCASAGPNRTWDPRTEELCGNQNCNRSRAISRDSTNIPRCNC